MNPIAIRFLVLLFCLILSLSINAANNKLDTEPATSQNEAPSENNQILSQSSDIDGYQPLVIAGKKIAATYLEEKSGQRYGAIILLHDQSDTIEDQGVVTPLRHKMPLYGWSTLSLALDYPFKPDIFLSTSIENNTSEAESAVPDTKQQPENNKSQQKSSLSSISNQQRVDAAINFLKSKGIQRLILLGHGVGGDIAVKVLEKETTPVQGLILVGTPSLTTDEIFKTFRHPVLDLYGENDLDGVSDAVQHRKTIMKRVGSNNYAIREIAGANHFFVGLDEVLVNTVRGWLKATFLDKN